MILHVKLCTFGGIETCHVHFHWLFSWLELDGLPLFSFFLLMAKKLALLIVKELFFDRAQMSLSFKLIVPNEMLRIALTSSSHKRALIISLFLSEAVALINSLTVTEFGNILVGDSTWKVPHEGSHLSSHILIFSPFPTLQCEPTPLNYLSSCKHTFIVITACFALFLPQNNSH